jgi:hypothetical protein
MKARDFIGKRIDVSKVGMLAFATYYEKTFDHPFIEIDLHDFDHKATTDEAIFDSYSLRVELAGNRIIDINRIGHHDMGGGHAGDDELSRFPYRSLEDQAQELLRILITELSASTPD